MNEMSVLIYIMFFNKIICLAVIASAIQTIFAILDMLTEITQSICAILAILMLDIVM